MEVTFRDLGFSHGIWLLLLFCVSAEWPAAASTSSKPTWGFRSSACPCSSDPHSACLSWRCPSGQTLDPTLQWRGFWPPSAACSSPSPPADPGAGWESSRRSDARQADPPAPSKWLRLAGATRPPVPRRHAAQHRRRQIWQAFASRRSAPLAPYGKKIK